MQHQRGPAVRRRRGSGAGGNVAWNKTAAAGGAYPPIELTRGIGMGQVSLKIPSGLFFGKTL